MGQGASFPGMPPKKDDKKKEKKKWEPPKPTRVGRKKKKQSGPESAYKLPKVLPTTKCRLRLLRLERIKDFLLMEQEFLQNQESLRPREEKEAEEKNQLDDVRGTPMAVGSLEEMIDDNHAIVSSSVGPEFYVGIASFVDRDQIEPGCTVLLHNKVMSVVGLSMTMWTQW